MGHIAAIIQILTTFDNNGSLKSYFYFYFERKTTNTKKQHSLPKARASLGPPFWEVFSVLSVSVYR